MDNNLEKIKWYRMVSRGRHHAVLFIDSVNDGNQKGYLRKNLGIDYVFRGYRQFDGSRWIAEDDYRNFVDILRRKTEKDALFLFRWAGHFEKYAKKIISETDKYRKNNLEKKSNSEILKILTKFQSYISVLWCGPMIYAWYFFFNDIALEELRNSLKKRHQNKLERLWEYIIQPEKLTLAGEEKLSLLKLARKLKKSGLDKKALRRHAEKYAYLNKYIYWGDGMTFGDVKKKMKEVMKKSASEINKEIGSFRQKKIGLEKFRLSKKEKSWIKGFKKMAYTVNLSDESCSYFAYHLKPSLKELAARLKINYEQLVSMTFEEIKNSVSKGEPVVSAQELLSRLRNHALVYFKNKTYIFTGEKLKEYKKNEAKKESKLTNKKIKELHGTVAFGGGKLKGKVKIIKDISEISSFEKGRILVTQMTNPTYLPAMQKALAVITDEGGLLCHAAVVARELKIPCIIGTKIATKVLKNGDLVEINIKKGIIEIIK